jgi:hypothetical protein
LAVNKVSPALNCSALLENLVALFFGSISHSHPERQPASGHPAAVGFSLRFEKPRKSDKIESLPTGENGELTNA